MISVFSGLSFVALIILMILFYRKRIIRKLGEAIEREIDISSRYYKIRKTAQNAKHVNDYRKNVIYNAFAFRIICNKVLTVRNARTIPFDELTTILKGTPKLDNKKMKTFIEIYESARYTASDITYENSRKIEEFLDGIINSLEVKVDDL